MNPAVDLAECVDRLLRGFRAYDRAVDVVSAFEFIYTESQTDLPNTVAHFARFPRIDVGADNPLTPDFTIVFTDNTGLVGEIARIALNDESVDSLCEQIAGYDELERLPGPNGELTEVANLDVLLLVPQDVGPVAVKRIIQDRVENTSHPYAPSRPPCILQFGYDEGRYLFQHLPLPGNGLPDDGSRPDGLGDWLRTEGQVKVKPERFREIKASRALMNDAPDALYLATHLWAKTFATMAGEIGGELPILLNVKPAELAKRVREEHGGVLASDVRRALELLTTAKLAVRDADGWTVAWDELRSGTGEHDLARIIARRACRPPEGSPLAKLKKSPAAPEQEDPPPGTTLF